MVVSFLCVRMSVCVCGGKGGRSGLLMKEKTSIGKSEEVYPIWTMKNIFLRDFQYSD